MKNIDWKKVKSLILTYAIPTLPLATAAFAMDASATVKFLTFLSGALAVIGREMNPKDPFTISVLKAAQDEIDKELAKQSKKK